MAKRKEREEVPEPSAKTTLIMNDEQTAVLDRLAIDHRLATGIPLSRSRIIYKMIAGADLKKLARELAAEARA